MVAPVPPKQAPMLTLGLLRAIDNACANDSLPFGLRLYAAIFMVVAMASLRFGDTKVAYALWATDTALCRRPRDLKQKGGPIFVWASPLNGLQGNSAWASVLGGFWSKQPPLKGGRRAFSPFVDSNWVVNEGRAAGYNVAIRMFRVLRATLGFGNTIWTLHSERAWLPTCANQLGWNADDRRKIGHMAHGSVMMDHYDRAAYTTELRLRDAISRKVRARNWEPTGHLKYRMISRIRSRLAHLASVRSKISRLVARKIVIAKRRLGPM